MNAVKSGDGSDSGLGIGIGAPPARQSAASVAAELIRAAIVNGRLRPGQPLGEALLSQELGVSRTPIREALLLLHADGLVELSPNRGARVAVYSRADLEDACGLRAAIESYAAGRAATRITDDQIEALQESCRRFDALIAAQADQADDVVALTRENMVFHALIHEASGSRRVPPIVRGLSHLPLLYRAHSWYSPRSKQISERHHHDIADALTAHDAERAAALMHQHVWESGMAALAAMAEQEAEGEDLAEEATSS